LAGWRGPDLVRLAALARVWATGLRQHDADDLLNETLNRVLSGRRPWPIDVPLPAFVSQVMRSIASQRRHEDRREPLMEDEAGEMFEEERNPGASYEMGDLISDVAAVRPPQRESPPTHTASETRFTSCLSARVKRSFLGVRKEFWQIVDAIFSHLEGTRS
jgi:DNA-directed RNA polymerase specialized sigma24 family protein